MHALRLLLAVTVVTTGAIACGPGKPASYPDRSKVEGSQKKWCEILADLDGDKLEGWGYRTDCLGAYPAGSSAYVSKLAECYGKTKKSLGDEAPDSAAIIDSCSVEILSGAEPGDVKNTALYIARCNRKERCSQVARAVCDQVWEQLDGSSRATLTSIYNLRAQAEIASCLDDTACSADEESAVDACYQPQRDAIVWTQLSLGADPGLGPKVD